MTGVFLLLSVVGTGDMQASQHVESDSVEVHVSTFNIRYNAAADVESGNGWNVRREPVAELILTHGFEIIGTQEGDQDQIADLLELMPQYAVTSYPYGGQGDLHNAAIFYRKDRFEKLDEGVFWLSETPDEPSIGWDATDPRVCQWARFQDQASGRIFYFFNAHFYWQLHQARAQSGPLIAKKIQEIAGSDPVILVGDFNSTAETSQIEAIRSMMNDTFQVTQLPPKGVEGTNLGSGNFLGPAQGRIDYIFVSKNIQVKDYAVFSDRHKGDRYPSDHLPVACNVRF